MLILTRKRDETILIGDDVRVTVVEIAGSWVRLGFDAPRSIHIDRAEVREIVKHEGRRPRLCHGTIAIPIGTGKSPP